MSRMSSPLRRQESLTPSESAESCEPSRSLSRSPTTSPPRPSQKRSLNDYYSSSSSMSAAGNPRSSQGTARSRPHRKHFFQPLEETFLAEQLADPEIEAVLSGPGPNSVNHYYRSKAGVQRILVDRFLDQFNVSLTDLQIKNKIATMRRQYSKAAAYRNKFDDGTRRSAVLKRRILSKCPFFEIVDDVWCRSWSFPPKSRVVSTAQGLSADDEAFESDEDGSIQEPDLSPPPLTPQQKQNRVSRGGPLRTVVEEKKPSRWSDENIAVVEDSRDRSRPLQESANDRLIRQYKNEREQAAREHKATLERIKKYRDTELEKIRLERVKVREEGRLVRERAKRDIDYYRLVTLFLEKLKERDRNDEKESKRRKIDADKENLGTVSSASSARSPS